jgi:hypothetical protein
MGVTEPIEDATEDPALKAPPDGLPIAGIETDLAVSTGSAIALG